MIWTFRSWTHSIYTFLCLMQLLLLLFNKIWEGNATVFQIITTWLVLAVNPLRYFLSWWIIYHNCFLRRNNGKRTIIHMSWKAECLVSVIILISAFCCCFVRFCGSRSCRCILLVWWYQWMRNIMGETFIGRRKGNACFWQGPSTGAVVNFLRR